MTYSKILKHNREKIPVIILSAGISQRMKSYEPRCLLKIDEKTIIETQVNTLRNSINFPDIILITGFKTQKVVKKTRDLKIHIIENQNYDSNSPLDSIKLGVYNNIQDCALIVNGDIVFNTKALTDLSYNKSFIIFDSNNMIKDREVGVTIQNNKAVHLSYGLDKKWCQMAFFAEKEYEMLKNICLNDNTNKLFFEIINEIIDSGGSFFAYEPNGMSVKEIDCIGDIKNESIVSE